MKMRDQDMIYCKKKLNLAYTREDSKQNFQTLNLRFFIFFTILKKYLSVKVRYF